jgi:hypothetical protein
MLQADVFAVLFMSLINLTNVVIGKLGKLSNNYNDMFEA